MLHALDLAVDNRVNIRVVHGAVDEQQHQHQECEREKETSHVWAFRATFRRQTGYTIRAPGSTSFLVRKVRFNGTRNQSEAAREGTVHPNTNVPTRRFHWNDKGTQASNGKTAANW